MLVKDVMTRNAQSVKKDEAIEKAMRILVDNRISGLPVVDGENKVVSMITKSDIVQLTLPTALKSTGASSPSLIPPVEKYLNKLKEVASKAVESVMATKKPITATEEMTVAEVAVLMYSKDVRRLPVVDKDSNLVGIVSYSDIAEIIAKNGKY